MNLIAGIRIIIGNVCASCVGRDLKAFQGVELGKD